VITITRELKIRELQLEQKSIQLDAEELMLALDTGYQEASTEIKEDFDKAMKLFNAQAEIKLAEYPEPVKETPVKEEKPVE